MKKSFYFQNLYNTVNEMYLNALAASEELDTDESREFWQEKAQIYDYILDLIEIACWKSDVALFDFEPENDCSLKIDAEFCLN